ncbi:MAG: phosphate butyryltransferase [Firmicutes bacterium]|jgi:phosphate butyryltransferase|nr:phosphate butyryltransferase [Bacillota bacterium]MDH7495516.1 phosphate butyryltransferase [Bacillota bacterium]
MVRNLEDLANMARDAGPKTCAVVSAADPEVLVAADEAARRGIARCVLIGDPAEIGRAASEVGIDLSGYDVVEEGGGPAAARRGVALVNSGKADLIMKGLVSTADVLRAVLDKDIGLRTGRLLSHLSVFQVPSLDRLLIFSDGAMNVAPGLGEKVQIVQNAIDVARRLGITEPRVAALAAVETVNPDMPATVDAACLAKMAERGQIKGGIVDGPLALDNAISSSAATHKGISSPVAGRADILIVPDIEAGNVFYKTLVYLAGGCAASVVVGAKAPVVITSRSDSHTAKVYSLALGVLLCK